MPAEPNQEASCRVPWKLAGGELHCVFPVPGSKEGKQMAQQREVPSSSQCPPAPCTDKLSIMPTAGEKCSVSQLSNAVWVWQGLEEGPVMYLRQCCRILPRGAPDALPVERPRPVNRGGSGNWVRGGHSPTAVTRSAPPPRFCGSLSALILLGHHVQLTAVKGVLITCVCLLYFRADAPLPCLGGRVLLFGLCCSGILP